MAIPQVACEHCGTPLPLRTVVDEAVHRHCDDCRSGQREYEEDMREGEAAEEAWAEFVMSWVSGGGRAEDAGAAFELYGRKR